MILDQLLDSMSVKTCANTYFVGPFTRRVNFASQQVRALNLVWALREHPRVALDCGKRVAIVGAGLAGLTAAAALKQQGLKPVIFEMEDRRCPLQADTSVRYAHPSLNFWPEMDLDPGCELPFLFWGAGVVCNVIASIERQWKASFADISILFGKKVVGIERATHGEIRLEFAGSALSEPFDVLILATGYGLEKALPGVSIGSYWANNNLPPAGSAAQRRFLVSGSGDGALLEVLRIAYEGFDNGLLTDRVARRLESENIGSTIRSIEEHARTLADSECCKYLASAYKKLCASSNLDADLRSTGGIALVALDGFGFTLSSAPVHKYMLAVAIQAGAVNVIAGSLVDGGADGLVILKCDGSLLRKVSEDVVVARHGAGSTLESLATVSEIAHLKRTQPVLAEYQYRQCWPSGYFGGIADGSSVTEITRHMRARLASARYLAGDLGADTVGVAPDADGEPQFVALVDPGSKTDPFPGRLFGRNLSVKQVEFRALADDDRGPFSRASTTNRRLCIGDPIAIDDAGGVACRGEISCFATAADGSRWLVTAAHVLNGARRPVFARTPEASSWEYVGETIEVGPLQAAQDVAIVRLADGVTFEPGIEARPTVHADSDALLGRKVVRRVSGQERWGTVSGVAAGVRLRSKRPEQRVTDALIVSDDATPFSQPGDSGALVRAENGEVVGIIVARSGQETLVVPIESALREIGVSLAVTASVARYWTAQTWAHVFRNVAANEQWFKPRVAASTSERALGSWIDEVIGQRIEIVLTASRRDRPDIQVYLSRPAAAFWLQIATLRFHDRGARLIAEVGKIGEFSEELTELQERQTIAAVIRNSTGDLHERLSAADVTVEVVFFVGGVLERSPPGEEPTGGSATSGLVWAQGNGEAHLTLSVDVLAAEAGDKSIDLVCHFTGLSSRYAGSIGFDLLDPDGHPIATERFSMQLVPWGSEEQRGTCKRPDKEGRLRDLLRTVTCIRWDARRP